MHGHLWCESGRHENDDRIRAFYYCDCGAQMSACFAKRLDDDGVEAWGKVGEWRYSSIIMAAEVKP